MTVRRATLSAGLIGVSLRPARAADLPECGAVWRESLNDYLGRLDQPAVPDELGPLGRLHAHTLATDPDRFVVATLAGPDGERVIGFGSAIERDPIWFLSMLFVRPEAQGQGLGRAILERLLPEPTFGGRLATVVDSLQPVSAALYATYGIAPRMPIIGMVGDVERPEAFPDLPSGVTGDPFESVADGPPGGAGHRALIEIVNSLDRESLGAEHPQDHRFLRTEGRHGFLYRGPDGAVLGYGYAGEVGRVGPVAVRDPALLEAVIGHLIASVPARGARAIWVSGEAVRLMPTLLAAGLRTDEFPLLVCWDGPFADFSRYLPISPGLL